MLRIGSIVWNAADNTRAAEFWTKALGYQQEKNPDFDFVVLADTEGNLFCVIG